MIKLLNSLTGRKEVLKTAVPGVLNWYACGPTVYDDAHLGHARAYITQDIIRRIIERYGQMQVNLQLGITDIDDKIIKKATLEGLDYKEISKKYEISFIKSLKVLNVKSPWKYSRVSDNVRHIIQFVQTLLDSGIAYQSTSGSIYFSVAEFQRRGFTYPKFKCSTNNDMAVEDNEKRNSADFALWKAAKPGEPCWKAFGGQGRPGWHIECSTMIHKGLGRLDLHSGGTDLRFPHHENEIAQSEAFLRTSPWCPQFIHFGHVKYGGEKMSKSLRNFITVDDFLGSHEPNTLRMMCLMKPYAEDFEIADSFVSLAGRNIATIRAFVSNCNLWIEQNIASLSNEFTEADLKLKAELEPMLEAAQLDLMDDFNTSKSLRNIMSVIDNVESSRQTNTVHPLLLEQLKLSVEEFFSALGLQLEDLENQNSTSLIDELVSFRSRVRRLSLTNAAPEAVLELCDQVRQALSIQRIAVNDSGSKSLWKFK